MKSKICFAMLILVITSCSPLGNGAIEIPQFKTLIGFLGFAVIAGLFVYSIFFFINANKTFKTIDKISRDLDELLFLLGEKTDEEEEQEEQEEQEE